MNNDLIKRLRNAANWADKGLVITPSVCLEAADAIEELNRLHEAQRQNLIALMNEDPEMEWIPVTERLPDHYETVLLYIESEPEGYITIGSYDYKEMRWKDFCDVNREVYQADVVTHWMNLPEPPKEETC